LTVLFTALAKGDRARRCSTFAHFPFGVTSAPGTCRSRWNAAGGWDAGRDRRRRPSAIDVFENTVGEDLIVSHNDATFGGPYPNTVVEGEKIGQCADL
jgi:hypothetical protein